MVREKGYGETRTGTKGVGELSWNSNVNYDKGVGKPI